MSRVKTAEGHGRRAGDGHDGYDRHSGGGGSDGRNCTIWQLIGGGGGSGGWGSGGDGSGDGGGGNGPSGGGGEERARQRHTACGRPLPRLAHHLHGPPARDATRTTAPTRMHGTYTHMA